MTTSLRYISTLNLIELAEYIVSKDYDEGLDVFLDEVLIALLDRLPLSAYHYQVSPIETRRKVQVL